MEQQQNNFEPGWGIILCGGGAPRREQLPANLSRILNQASYVCAADSGYLHARELALQVDFLTGDMDSLAERGIDYRQLGVPYACHPVDKEQTDGQLALAHLQEQGYERILQIGAGSGRLDQLLTHYYHYYSASQPEIWLSDLGQIYHVDRQLVIENQQGAHLGAFALEPCQMSSSGLRWPLGPLQENASPCCHSACNIIDADRAVIKVEYGRAMVVINYRRQAGN